MKIRRGVALLLVTGIVGLLGVVAVAFVTLSRLERRASSQRVHATQALLLARSGLEDALARFVQGQDPQERAAKYRGEDWDASGTLTGIEAASQVVNPAVCDRDTCPVRHAMRPSFFARDLSSLGADGLPAPLLVRAEGRQRGYTGRMLADADPERSYAAFVGGEEGLYVNGGDLRVPGEGVVDATYNTTLKRILGNLAVELGAPFVRADGEALVTARPVGGWASFEQIRGAALGGSQAKLDAIRPYLALHAWVDLKVVKPTIDPAWSCPATGTTNVQTAGAWAEIRAGSRDALPTGVPTDDPYSWSVYLNTSMVGAGMPWSGKRVSTAPGRFAPDFERDSSGAVVGRAPVNLNWARDKPPVLKALLRDLSGVFLDSNSDQGGMLGLSDFASPMNPWTPVGYIGLLHRVSFTNLEVNALTAQFVNHTGFTPAQQAVYTDWDGTASFDSWDEFNAFLGFKCLGSVGGTADQKAAKLSLLKANFNPNTDLNKFNPGETFYNPVDKSDLLRYSTEFCFRTPRFGASCVGRVLSPEGKVLSERVQSGSFALAQVRLTTQSEFCAGDLGRLDRAGDETSIRRPGDSGFIQACSGVSRASGSRFPGLAAGGGSPGGAALQTYPEPQWPAAPGACPDPAVYDGNLQLATLERGDGGTTFLAAYDDAYDADSGVSTAMIPDVRHGPVSLSLLEEQTPGGAAEMSMLYPDGCYSEAYRTPRYSAPGNIGDGHTGMLSLWYKPALSAPSHAYELDFAHLPTNYMGYSLIRNFTLFHLERTSASLSGAPQPLFLGGLRRKLDPSTDPPLGCNLLTGHSMLNDNGAAGTEFYYATLGQQAAPITTLWRARRWCHVALKWWMPAHPNPVPVPPGSLTVALNGLQSTVSHQPPGGLLILPTESLTQPDFRSDGTFGAPWFSLGEMASGVRFGANFYGLPEELNAPYGPCDGTLDEVCFLPAPDMNGASLAAFSGFEYIDGRYVKENEGKDPLQPEYRSAPLLLESGACLTRVDWTFILPRSYGGPAFAPDAFLNANQAMRGTGAVVASGAHAHAEITLMDGAGAALLPGRLFRSGTAVALPAPAGGLRVGVNLCPAMEDNVAPYDKLSLPILESPVLDDVTVTYVPAAGPRLLSWGGE